MLKTRWLCLRTRTSNAPSSPARHRRTTSSSFDRDLDSLGASKTTGSPVSVRAFLLGLPRLSGPYSGATPSSQAGVAAAAARNPSCSPLLPNRFLGWVRKRLRVPSAFRTTESSGRIHQTVPAIIPYTTANAYGLIAFDLIDCLTRPGINPPGPEIRLIRNAALFL